MASIHGSSGESSSCSWEFIPDRDPVACHSHVNEASVCSAGAGRLWCLQAVLGVLQQGFGSRHCPGRVKTHLTQNGSQEIAIPSLLGRRARLLLKYPNESFRCVCQCAQGYRQCFNRAVGKSLQVKLKWGYLPWSLDHRRVLTITDQRLDGISTFS